MKDHLVNILKYTVIFLIICLLLNSIPNIGLMLYEIIIIGLIIVIAFAILDIVCLANPMNKESYENKDQGSCRSAPTIYKSKESFDQTPPAQPVQTPPVQTPPIVQTPVQNPPIVQPPAQPVQTPPVQTPPAQPAVQPVQTPQLPSQSEQNVSNNPNPSQANLPPYENNNTPFIPEQKLPMPPVTNSQQEIQNNQSLLTQYPDLKYSELPLGFHKPLGSYDNTFTNDFDHGYSYLNTDKWTIPERRPPVCITDVKCPVCPVTTSGYPLSVKEFADSQRIYPHDNINVPYVKDRMNDKYHQ